MRLTLLPGSNRMQYRFNLIDHAVVRLNPALLAVTVCGLVMLYVILNLTDFWVHGMACCLSAPSHCLNQCLRNYTGTSAYADVCCLMAYVAAKFFVQNVLNTSQNADIGRC